MSSRVALVALFCVAAWCTGGAAAATGAEWRDLVFSIPMKVDPPGGREGLHWRYVKSPLQIRVRAKAYDQTMGGLAGSPDLDEAERALVGVVNAVRSGDRQKFFESMPPGEEFEWYFPAYADVWSQIEGEPVHYQMKAGPYLWFLFSQSRLGGVMVFERDRNRLLVDPNAVQHPMGQVLGDLSWALTVQGAEFQPLTNREGVRWLEIPWQEGTDSGYPVVLGFDGGAADWPLFEDDPKKRKAPPWAEAPLLAYRKAAEAAREGRYEDYLPHLGPRSRKDLSEWLEKLKAQDQMEHAPRFFSSKLRVVYVMRSEKVVLLFHINGPRVKDSQLSYSFLAATPEGGWQIVNTNYRTAIDKLLRWPPFEKALWGAE